MEEQINIEKVKEDVAKATDLIPDKKVQKNLSIYEAISMNLFIKDGWNFIKNLRKEARRQKAMKAAEQFEKQTREIDSIPTEEPSHAYERKLADTFEIYEED